MINLTGKQKSQILISLLEENSSTVLKELSEASSKILSESLEDVPELDNNDKAEYLDQTLTAIRAISFEESSNIDDLEENESSDLDSIELDESLDTDQEEQEESTSEPKYPENYRKVEVIASKLAEQSIQMIAFFFAQIEDPLKSDLVEVLDQQILEDIKHVDIEMVPISKKVFEKLFDFIVIKKENEDNVEEDESEDSDDLSF